MSSRKRPYPGEQDFASEIHRSRYPRLPAATYTQPSPNSILRDPIDQSSGLDPMSRHASKGSESANSPSYSVHSLVSPDLQHHPGCQETPIATGLGSGDTFSEGRLASPSKPTPAALVDSGTNNLGPWWTTTLEETLAWSSLCRPGYQKPCVVTLTHTPLLDVRLLPTTKSSHNGSLPTAPDRETFVSLDDADEMSRFVDKFLRNVHVRNPLIEPTFLQEQVAVAAEIGLQWDGAACLLLIACACGAISSDFNIGTLEDYSVPSKSTHDYLASREYFDAGRKRLGLLGDVTSQTAVMCFFFTGVYYMCTLRPVAAWRSFNTASIMCRHQLQRAKSDAPALHNSDARQRRQQWHLDSKLYWSCVKSEREVAIELGIHPSNTSLMEYANTLPLPPTPPTLDETQIQSLSPETISPSSPALSDSVNAYVYKQSWFYYLTDITVRKLEMQVDEYVHRDGEPPSGSTLPVRESFYQKIMTTLSDADERITAHYSALPQIIAFDMDEQYHSADDLREYLRYRMLATRQNLHRPALYIVLHHPDDISRISTSLRERMITMAYQELVFDIHFIRHALTTHRTTGTWLLIRHVTRCAFELLAAWKTRSPWLDLDPQWNGSLELFKVALRYWSKESGDAPVYLELLERLQHG